MLASNTYESKACASPFRIACSRTSRRIVSSAMPIAYVVNDVGAAFSAVVFVPQGAPVCTLRRHSTVETSAARHLPDAYPPLRRRSGSQAGSPALQYIYQCISLIVAKVMRIAIASHYE